MLWYEEERFFTYYAVVFVFVSRSLLSYVRINFGLEHHDARLDKFTHFLRQYTDHLSVVAISFCPYQRWVRLMPTQDRTIWCRGRTTVELRVVCVFKLLNA